MYGGSVSPYYRDMSSWSVAKLIREIEQKKEYIKMLYRVPMAGREPGHFLRAETDLMALEAELERRG